MRFWKKHELGRRRWRRIALAFGLAMLALPLAQPADAQMRGNRSAAQGRPSAAQTRPLPEIVARVQATPPYSSMDYIGVAGFDERQLVYLLRFINGRQVIVVHVDARSGRIIGRQP